MPAINWRQLAGQERIKEVLASAFANKTLGHAYLLCGDSGTGTFAAALDIAAALLCLNETVKPCGECAGCRKVGSFSHPDFHVVMPLSLQKEHKGSDGKITEAGWEEFAARVRERLADPYLVQEFSSLPTIPVDWIREVTQAIRRGSSEKGKNIVILDGIDCMQKESANAMLKTLEEPPPDTLLLLCTERVHAVLPTIISRCQLLRFAALPPEVVKRELIARYQADRTDPRLDGVACTGSIGRAWHMLQHGDADEQKNADTMWELIVKRDWPALFTLFEEIGDKADYSSYENLFSRFMYGIRNVFLTKVTGSENYIMGDGRLNGLNEGTLSTRKVEHLTLCCESAIKRIRARANVPLVLTNFALSVMEILDEQKQQSR
jgi:DNA polymerase-3 subunit delta'